MTKLFFSVDIKNQMMSNSEYNELNGKLEAILSQNTILCDMIEKLDNRVKALENKK